MDKPTDSQVRARVRANADVRLLIDCVPLTNDQKESIWGVLAVAYSAGMCDGFDTAVRIVKAKAQR